MYMAALRFTTIPCEPYTANKVQRTSCSCANDMTYVIFEDVTASIFCKSLCALFQVLVLICFLNAQKTNFLSPQRESKQ